MLTFHPTPTIVGQRVRLRPFDVADHDALWAMVNDDGRLTGTHATFTREGVDRRYASRGEQPDERLDLAIASLDGDTCVGEVVLNELDPDNASCAFRICLTGPRSSPRARHRSHTSAAQPRLRDRRTAPH